jgi:hypothetical protein
MLADPPGIFVKIAVPGECIQVTPAALQLFDVSTAPSIFYHGIGSVFYCPWAYFVLYYYTYPIEGGGDSCCREAIAGRLSST